MKQFLSLGSIAMRFVIASIFICGIVQAVIAPVKPSPPTETNCPIYYDGEGNIIPQYAVKLLVMSEFVRMNAQEIDTIQRYFYLKTRHLCPFTHCPMIDQVTFHGCGDCDEGSDCYSLDAIHWDYPTASYDDCEDMLFGVQKQDTLITKQSNNEQQNYTWSRKGVRNRSPIHQ